MSDTNGTNWRQRMKAIGKDAFIREEMTRLGYWPPTPEVAAQAADAEARLKELYTLLAAERDALNEVQKELTALEDVAGMIAEIRKRRIERSRATRAARKEERERQRAEHKAQEQTWRRETLPYLGEGVSGGLQYQGGDPARLESLGLPALTTAAEVAAAIGIDTRELAWLTYHRGAAATDHYTRFTIPKRTGGTRTISSPKRKLRVAQTWLLQNVLTPLPVHPAATAFRPKTGIAANAERHTGKAVVIRLDLKDFFPSITFPRVKGFFRKLGYNEGVATLLALLATEAPRVALTLDEKKRFVSVGKRQLPQGACTSPALTNLLCRRLDARLQGASEGMDFTYTRYADDLVFSHSDSDVEIGVFLAFVRTIIGEEGYTVKEEKTAVMRPQHRQAVTGLVVNETPRVSRHDLRRFRAFLHQVQTQGAPAVSERIGRNALAYASGYLAFLHGVCPEQEAQIHRAYPWLERWRKNGHADG